MSERELLALLDCLPCAVLVADEEGRLRAASRSAFPLLRDDCGPLSDRALEDAVRPEFVGTVLGVFEEIRAGGYALPRQLDVDLGGYSMLAGLAGSLLPELFEGGAAVVLTLQDLTANRELAQREERDRQRKSVLSEASHEIRNPMTGVLGYLELLAEADLDPRQLRLLERALREGRRVMRIVSDVLDAARLRGGAVRLRREVLDLGDLVAEVAEGVRTATPTARIEVVERAPAGCLRVRGDEQHLARVFWNLLENAVKYSPPGAPIQAILSRVDTAAEVRVVDRGLGIAPSDLPHVFDSFYRAGSQEVRERAGSGLGLSVVLSVVEAHGGVVGVESVPGAGSTFTVRLPLAVARPHSPAA
ncbi:MAG: sensor histidine kinase [Planctomycetota bacterium]|nr:MAG: sensor histidine kinase [Planctomycetota bacterium]